MMQAFCRLGLCCLMLALALSVSACGSTSSDKNHVTGKRVPILATNNKKINEDANLRDFDMALPVQHVNKNWAQAGGNAEHNPQHLSLGLGVDFDWDSSIGSGSSGDFRLLAQPIVVDDKVFTLDAEGRVSAFKTKNGSREWHFDTTPDDRDDPAMGGGLGFEDNVLYVTTGFGEVLALNPQEGKVIWRKMVGKPFRAAPTLLDHHAYVVTIDNELHALDTRTGEELWHHSGIAENATLMGSSSPAVEGDSVVVAYSSGEIFNLRAQNGRAAWSDVLAASSQVGALPAIADIRGLPVIDHGRVYAISHSGRMAAIDLRSGERVWEADIGGTNTPVVVGDAVFVLSNDNELIALTRESGRVVWIKQLAKLEKSEDRDSKPVQWYGPVFAGGSLWLTNSLGHLMAYGPTNGDQKGDLDFDEPSFIAPVVANEVLYAITDNGRLYAIKTP